MLDHIIFSRQELNHAIDCAGRQPCQVVVLIDYAVDKWTCMDPSLANGNY
jgi:hypothetical protein